MSLKKRLIAHKFGTGCFVVVVRSPKRVAGQFAVKYKKEATCWIHNLNKQDYGLDEYFYFCGKQKGLSQFLNVSVS